MSINRGQSEFIWLKANGRSITLEGVDVGTIESMGCREIQVWWISIFHPQKEKNFKKYKAKANAKWFANDIHNIASNIPEIKNQ